MSVTKAKTNSIATFAKYDNASAGNTSVAGQFVAAGNASTVLTSPDGITWTARTASGTWNAIDKRFGIFNIWTTGTTASTTASSTDGVTWTVATTPNTYQKMWLYDAASPGARHVQDDGTGVYVDNSSGVLMVGAGFRASTSAVINGSSWNGQQIMLSVQGGAGNIYYSGNAGATWTNIQGSILYYSQWSFQNLHIGFSSAGVMYGYTPSGGLFGGPSTGWSGSNIVVIKTGSMYFCFDAASGTARTNIYSSPDGTTWTSRTITSTIVGSIAYGNGTYVLVGSGGNVQTSPDGNTWTARTSGTANALNGVVFG